MSPIRVKRYWNFSFEFKKNSNSINNLVNAVFESNGALVRKKDVKKENSKNEIQIMHEEFLKLFKNYDKRIRPGLGAPLPVTVNMLVQSISKLDQVDMRYEMGVFLRQEWTDPRLDFRSGYFNGRTMIQTFWSWILCYEPYDLSDFLFWIGPFWNRSIPLRTTVNWPLVNDQAAWSSSL